LRYGGRQPGLSHAIRVLRPLVGLLDGSTVRTHNRRERVMVDCERSRIDGRVERMAKPSAEAARDLPEQRVAADKPRVCWRP